MKGYDNDCRSGLYESIDWVWVMIKDDKKVVIRRFQ